MQGHAGVFETEVDGISYKKSTQLISGQEVVSEGIQAGDSAILLLGTTGAGKSTFINAAAGCDAVVVDHGLEPCTKEVKLVAVQHPTDPDRRVVLVDTPGFEDTWADGESILKAVVDRLSFGEMIELTGIIYLQDVTQRSTAADQAMLFGLARSGLAEEVLLVATKWSERNREQLLQADWARLLEKGTQQARFTSTRASAWEAIDLIRRGGAQQRSILHESIGILGQFALAFQVTLPSRNIIIFGETGAGKSSLVNMILGEERASTSYDAGACTLKATRYMTTIETQQYNIFDTVGLEEPKTLQKKERHLETIANAYELLTSLATAGGVHLLVFCFRAGRLTEATRRTYSLFHDFMCDGRV
ncbi:P-loop containing nucleoside triphosphate hydrolase protein, partial [Hygrophoropsis aurantiaca]